MTFKKLTKTSLIALATLMAPSAVFGEIFDERYFQDLKYRNIGPFRGGRATAIAGVAGDPATYYMGATGGVFKTTDGGNSWNPISDKWMKTGSVGAIAVAASNPSIVVVGMGESPYRGVASSHGDGVYKSVDGGKSFQHLGLKEARQISTILIHPQNPDIFWVAVQGSPWAPTKIRGVYKTSNGGATFEQVLYTSDVAGAIDLTLDPDNPEILIAALWDNEREPWEIRSGGPESALWRSKDGGDTWTRLEKGLPDLMGKIGVVASPAKKGRVYAIIEAKDKPGLYRSEDYGETWSHITDYRPIYSRPWYYMHIYADPLDADVVYVQNAQFYKSIDGGKTFAERITGSHGDWHDLWINPSNPRNMGVANDGGAAVSVNGGKSWSTQMNQPTAQFYRVNTDNSLFYRLYSGQQDNSALGVRSHGPDGGIGLEDYVQVAGCESAHVAFDPDKPDVTYGGCYLGQIDRKDVTVGVGSDVRVYPEIAFGVAPKDRRYRFNWNAPISTSAFDRSVLYHAGNHVFRSTDQGQSWEQISPDLTRNTPETQGPGGQPITNEVSENYNTLFALEESPHSADTLWAGSDDGLVHVTTNGGESWQDVTPNKRGKGLINAIEISPHNPDKVFVVFTGYKWNDHKPYIYKSTNAGKRWRNSVNGIAEGDFIRVVREDPVVEGLLYAGSETGIYVSFDDGENWQSLRLNLPHVPVTDLTIQDDDLAISTQGRAFWVFDDLSALRAYAQGTQDSLFSASDAIDIQYGGRADSLQMPNPPKGMVIHYALPEGWNPEADTVALEIKDASGATIWTAKSDPKHKGMATGRGASYSLPAKAGLNRLTWSMEGDPLAGIKGSWGFLWQTKAETAGGLSALPGDYSLTLTLHPKDGEDVVRSTEASISFDPRFDVSDAAWATKKAMLTDLRSMYQQLVSSVAVLRAAKGNINSAMAGVEDQELKDAAKALKEEMKSWETSVFSPERSNFQDVLNFPDRLVSDISFMLMGVDGAVPPLTKGYADRLADLKVGFETAVAARDMLVGEKLAAFNALYKSKEVEAVRLAPFKN